MPEAIPNSVISRCHSCMMVCMTPWNKELYIRQHFKQKGIDDHAQSRFRLPLLVALKSLTFIWGGDPLPSHRHIETSSSAKRFLGFPVAAHELSWKSLKIQWPTKFKPFLAEVSWYIQKCPTHSMKKSVDTSRSVQHTPWRSQLIHPKVSNTLHEEVSWCRPDMPNHFHEELF